MDISSHSSLSNRLSTKMSASVLMLAMPIAISIFLTTFLLSRQIFNQQVHTWIAVVPRYVLTHLIDSDYFSVKREVNFLESTELFSGFVIMDNQKNIVAQFGSVKNKMAQLIPITDEAKITWGYFTYDTNFNKYFLPFLVAGVIFLILIFTLYILIRWRLAKNLKVEFQRFNQFLANIELVAEKVEKLHDMDELEKNIDYPVSDSLEQERINRAITRLIDRIKHSHKRIKTATIETEQKKHKEELTKTALQVAHDIRSPLAALNMSVQAISALPEESRILIRNATSRIHDIANTLLKKNSQFTDKQNANETFPTKQLLSSIIHMLVTEKRLQYRSHPNIEIECKYELSSYGLFAYIKISDFKRILSNIINNSVEAISGKGKITIFLSSENDDVAIVIQDTGKGMTHDILNKIGLPGITYGKSDGSGLGLYHAKVTLESWKGGLNIQSARGRGTTVKILLPKVQPPLWFVPALRLHPDEDIVVIDDDVFIHAIWKKRIRQFSEENNSKISLYNLYSLQEFSRWIIQHPDKSKVTYLCDYEFIGQEEKGLDIIKNNNLFSSSILVTSRFEEPDIVAQCEQMKVRMIPKDLASIVPLIIQNSVIVDAILIDDDPLVHSTWQLAAKRNKKLLACYFQYAQFIANATQYAHKTVIYIDSNLGDGEKGEYIAEQLFNKGFQNIYLATGSELDTQTMPFLQGIAGKEPPWN